MKMKDTISISMHQNSQMHGINNDKFKSVLIRFALILYSYHNPRF